MTEARINFSNGDSTANTNGTWTNANTLGLNDSFNILDWVGGSDLGWDIEISDAPDGALTSGVNAIGTGDAAFVDEATVSANAVFASNTSTMQYTISGLNDSNTYTFTVFASRDAAGGNRNGRYSFNGGATQDLAANQNSTEVVTFIEVSPSSGVITFDANPAQTSSNTGYLNALRIEEIAGPSSGIQVLRRRIEGY